MFGDPPKFQNVNGAKWFISFIDDCTRVTWIYLLKEKSEVSQVIPKFCKMVSNQFGVSIRKFHSDNARDYFNHNLNSFFDQEGIIHESSCVDTPQQNGVAERKNRHLLNVTRSLLFQMHVPKHFWGEAVLTVAFSLTAYLPSLSLTEVP